jgi:hypothetical protein
LLSYGLLYCRKDHQTATPPRIGGVGSAKKHSNDDGFAYAVKKQQQRNRFTYSSFTIKEAF